MNIWFCLLDSLPRWQALGPLPFSHLLVIPLSDAFMYRTCYRHHAVRTCTHLSYFNGIFLNVSIRAEQVLIRIWWLERIISRCPYIPTGLHLLYILWRNRLVRGCPYEVNVTSGSSSSSVLCSGEGLREGVVSQQFSVHVDARRAAPG